MNVSEISWILFLITVFKMVFFSNSLKGDHVCSRLENYTITSYETYIEPVVVNTFIWCLQIPPRCPKTRTELRQRYRVKTEEKSKTVEECCEGYRTQIIFDTPEMEWKCLPYCEKCLGGVCIAPNECRCNPGYQGDDCARECPLGSWGPQCTQICDCGNGTCDPVNGTCRCPPGLQGFQCKENCITGQWGPNCANKCTCQKQYNDCDAATGRCHDDDNDDDEDASSIEHTTPVYLRSSTTKRTQTLRINNVEYTEVISVPRETTERQTEGINGNWNSVNYVPEKTAITDPSQKAAPNATLARVSSTTVRPVIVLVSVPERKRDVEKDRKKFATKETFFRDVQSDANIGASKIDYVKTDKESHTSTPIPLDIALIVMAAIVCLGLTSVAVVMLLHMRSKLFENVRLTIYDDEKSKKQEGDNMNGERISTVINSSLPPPPTHANSANTEAETILTVDGIESLNTYSNGAATIGLRIFGNLRDLLQDGYYDQPSATLIRLQTNFDRNTEHVYDEIPLQITPLSNRKDM